MFAFIIIRSLILYLSLPFTNQFHFKFKLDPELLQNGLSVPVRSVPAYRQPSSGHVLMKKLACWVLMVALPMRFPFRPAASINRPALSPGGFLNIEPMLAPGGWLRRRLAWKMLHFALDGLPVAMIEGQLG